MVLCLLYLPGFPQPAGLLRWPGLSKFLHSWVHLRIKSWNVSGEAIHHRKLLRSQELVMSGDYWNSLSLLCISVFYTHTHTHTHTLHTVFNVSPLLYATPNASGLAFPFFLTLSPHMSIRWQPPTRRQYLTFLSICTTGLSTQVECCPPDTIPPLPILCGTWSCSRTTPQIKLPPTWAPHTILGLFGGEAPAKAPHLWRQTSAASLHRQPTAPRAHTFGILILRLDGSTGSVKAQTSAR